MRWPRGSPWFVVVAVGASCGSPTSETGARDLGKSCLPNDEMSPDFGGFSEKEITFDVSAGCSGVCLIANFRGRVSCPYGQPDPSTAPVGANESCFLPMTKVDPVNQVRVQVEPQLVDRRPDVSVYCSCRCGAAPLCTCPQGFLCVEVLAGNSYCMKDGTQVSSPPALANGPACLPAACGVPHPFGL